MKRELTGVMFNNPNLSWMFYPHVLTQAATYCWEVTKLPELEMSLERRTLLPIYFFFFKKKILLLVGISRKKAQHCIVSLGGRWNSAQTSKSSIYLLYTSSTPIKAVQMVNIPFPFCLKALLDLVKLNSQHSYPACKYSKQQLGSTQHQSH